MNNKGPSIHGILVYLVYFDIFLGISWYILGIFRTNLVKYVTVKRGAVKINVKMSKNVIKTVM